MSANPVDAPRASSPPARSQALERVIRRARSAGPPPTERCRLCAAELPDDHPHAFDAETRGLLCVCLACSILFDRPGAGGGHYRRIPDRRVRLDGLDPARVGVPVGLAFFVVGDDETVTAGYPSPGGATRWEVDRGDWQALVATCPELGDLVREVEALLVNTARGHSEAWIVPVSDGFRLVGLVRQHWEGLNGGESVWQVIDSFFDELRRSHGTATRR